MFDRNGLIYNHSGDYSRKVPPVPIPNTEVKLSYAESTCRDTGREDRASPLFIIKIRLFGDGQSKNCSLAQSVEHRTVNPSVVSSSLTGAAIYVDRNYWFGQKRVKNACFWLFFIYFLAFLRIFLRLKYVSWPCRFHCWFLAFFWKIKVWTYNIPILAIF